MTILGFNLPYIPERKESPQFDPPEPAYPRTMDVPLPPRPPSQ
jgi:hypothetical protein